MEKWQDASTELNLMAAGSKDSKGALQHIVGPLLKFNFTQMSSHRQEQRAPALVWIPVGNRSCILRLQLILIIASQLSTIKLQWAIVRIYPIRLEIKRATPNTLKRHTLANAPKAHRNRETWQDLKPHLLPCDPDQWSTPYNYVQCKKLIVLKPIIRYLTLSLTCI